MNVTLYAVKVTSTGCYLALNEDDGITTTREEDEAKTYYTRRCADALQDRYKRDARTSPISDPPSTEVVTLKRQLQVHHPW